jgi:acetyl esterase/lipase
VSHQLDIYRPNDTRVAAPVVVFFYGGNWNSGQRADYRFAGAALAAKGYVAVLPDYRLYPEVRYPDFLADSAQAVRWVFDHIAEFAGDARNVFLMGHSAGAA